MIEVVKILKPFHMPLHPNVNGNQYDRTIVFDEFLA